MFLHDKMRLISIIFIGVTSVLAQQDSSIDSAEVHPCDSPLIEMKNGGNSRSFKIKELVPYTVALVKCRFSDRGKDKSKLKDKRRKRLAYNEGSNFKSFSSSCAYCAVYMVVVFYLSSIF